MHFLNRNTILWYYRSMWSVCLNPVKRYLHYLDVVSPPPIRAQHLITCLPSEPMRGEYLMEAIVQGPHPPVLSFMSRNWHYSPFLENINILKSVWKWKKNLICLRPPPGGGGLGQKVKIEKFIFFWDFWLKWTECTFLIETQYYDTIYLCEVSALC